MGYSFDVKKETENCIQWVKDWFSDKGEDSLVFIGISGGVDSSTTAAICVKALGKDRVIGLKLPCGEQSDIDYSNELISSLGIEDYTIDILDAYEGLTRRMKALLEKKGITKPSDLYSTNTPARIRMAAIYGAAAIYEDGYPANTCNISETICGYDTIWGDSCGAFAPIARFTKSEVREIAKYLGLSERLYNKTPIDGMSLNKDGSYMSDEDKLGFTYEELDKFIRTGETGANNEKILRTIKKSAWKRRYINIDYYNPDLPFPAESLW